MTVGIGASAGGLKAFTDFLQTVPADSGMAYVLIQHLAPDHESALAEILARASATPVQEARDGDQVEADMIFVIPPNATLTIKDGILRLERPAPPRQLRRPIDTFIASLAEDQRENAVCIILSGTGSDGTQGVKAIKEHGGLTIAQSEFDHVPMGGMPDSAAATGLIDEVLPVEAMFARVSHYAGHLAEVAGKKDGDGIRTDIVDQLPAIARLLRNKIGHDFSGYKENTLLRRVQRRMQLLELAKAPAYVERLRTSPEEVDLLFKDLLIGVTQFFRDPEVFAALESRGLPLILGAKAAGDPVRVWIPGCATGEEVYSVAILLRESLEQADTDLRVQIFGTDIDERAIAFARSGQYRRVAGISPERLKRWFVESDDAFTPVKDVREMCVFSVHSVIKDPPFSKLDLISCRNLLIYLNAELQDRVLQSFHYGLNPGSILMLGPSEGVSRLSEAFLNLDKENRLFQRLPGSALSPGASYVPPLLPSAPPGELRALPMAKEDRVDRNARRALEKYSPAYVVIDPSDNIVRFSGSETRNYLEPSSGSASLNVLSLLNKALRSIVRDALKQVRADKVPAVLDKIALSIGGSRRCITVIVSPLAQSKLLVLAFRDDGLPESRRRGSRKPEDQDEMQALESELAATKAHLQSTIDDLELAREEMRGAIEEYQSVNEELQSSNEELETAKEEMQSVNEELHAINAEMIRKNDRLTHLNNDLNNLLDSTQIATLFLGPDLTIRNFTPAMTDILHLRESDRGRPVTDIVSMLAYESLREDINKVLRDFTTVEREVQLRDGQMTFIMRIRPYRTADNRIDGVVMTFVDITERQKASDTRPA